jgi:pimeloyl-ACP methyl ester carboxylesterase
MKNEIENINFFEEIKEVKVPVYFLEGRYDFSVPSLLALEYLNKLKAPNKELVWFEKSAHWPNVEEADKFQKVIIDRINKIEKK